MNLNDKLGVSICRAQPLPKAQQHPLMAVLACPRHTANLASYCNCHLDLMENGDSALWWAEMTQPHNGYLCRTCEHHWI